MNGLQGCMACNAPLYAMFALEDGKPVARRVQVLGVVQTSVKDDVAYRVVAGYVVCNGLSNPEGGVYEAGALAPADFIPGFLGYAEDQGTGAWEKPARECRKRIKEAQAKSKLYVPDDKIVAAVTKKA